MTLSSVIAQPLPVSWMDYAACRCQWSLRCLEPCESCKGWYLNPLQRQTKRTGFSEDPMLTARLREPWRYRSPGGSRKDVQRLPKGYPRDTQGIPKGYPRATQGIPKGYPRDTQGIPKGYPRDTQGIPKGYPRDTQGILKGTTGSHHRSNTGATPDQRRGSSELPKPPNARSEAGVQSGLAGSVFLAWCRSCRALLDRKRTRLNS